MQATARQPQRGAGWRPAPATNATTPNRPRCTAWCGCKRLYAASFIAHTEASTGAELPRFTKEEFDAFLECGILAYGFLRLRCG